jgi:hypothetical protein
MQHNMDTAMAILEESVVEGMEPGQDPGKAGRPRKIAP